MLAYLRLEIRRMLRHRRYLILSLAFPAIFYVLYTRTGMGGRMAAVVGGTSWNVYFMISMISWGLVSAAMASGGGRLAAERSSGWLRQLRITPLKSVDYLVARLLSGLVLAILSMALMAGIAVVADGVSLPLLEWVEVFALLLVGGLSFGALGLLLGFLFDVDSAQVVSNLIIFGLAILGGLFEPISVMPSAMAAIARALPAYHLADMGWRIVGGSGIDPTDVVVVAAYGVLFGALAIWRFRVDAARA